jgi:hypothetical protein
MANEANTENLDVKTEVSSTSTDVKGVDSSNTKTAATETKTVDDVINEVFNKSQSSSDKVGEESDVQSLNATEKKEEEASEEKKDTSTSEEHKEPKGEEESKKVDEKVDKGPIPYERFDEVNKAKVDLENRFKEVEPVLAEFSRVADICTKGNVTEQQFNYWLEVASLANTNPEAALAKLEQILPSLKTASGDALPSDLQIAVDNNDVPLAIAKRLAKAEAQAKFVQQRSVTTEQQMVQQNQQRFVNELHSSMNVWLDNKKGNDPDFVPKSSPNAADGKFELFVHKMALDARSGNVKNSQDLIALAEKTYASIDSTVKRFIPKPNGTKVLSSTRSSSSSKMEPRSVDDVIAARAAKHGIQYEVPSRK